MAAVSKTSPVLLPSRGPGIFRFRRFAVHDVMNLIARTSAEKEHPLAKENASDAEQVLRSETSLFSPTSR